MKPPPRIAAIDIGSNSIKLAVADAAGAGTDSLNLCVQQRERVRSASAARRGKFLSPETIEKSAVVVRKFRAIAESLGAETIIAVATASAREATNASDFVGEIEREAGVRVKVLPAIEEARLIGLAARYYFRATAKGALLNVDIGGGSTELSLMKTGDEPEPEKLFSMPLGALRLTEKFLSANPPTAAEIAGARAEIRLNLEKPSGELRGENWQTTTGTSGTILKFGALLNSENGEIHFAELARLNRKLAKMTVAERAALPHISEKRAELLVAGGLILEGTMQALKIEKLHSCRYALREGVIIDFLRSNPQGARDCLI